MPDQSGIDRLKQKLREIFQLDRGDLDFGIYRIMNLKNREIVDFLDNRLLPQVGQALDIITKIDKSVLEEDLDRAIEQAKNIGIDPDEAPKVQEIKDKIKSLKEDKRAEVDTYNHLYNFFSRYYKEGDFISSRRYKGEGKEAYAIPYNGEEIKLHWANADQYYIKTTENYSSYTFVLKENSGGGGGGKYPGVGRVCFEIKSADNEKDAIQAAEGEHRYFFLADRFLKEDREKGWLYLYFEHRPLTVAEKKRYKVKGANGQISINRFSEESVFSVLEHHSEWRDLLGVRAPTEADPDRTLFGKHLAIYTSKNSFDYFIHKNLGGFLRRELDFYLKSEVISIDNLKPDTPPSSFARDLAQVRAIKSVGEKIIDFIAQIEDFQKQLWLKKKFVLETQYCVTLDKIPESLYREICDNDAQRREWQDLFAIDDLEGGDRPTPDFLLSHPYLILDTRHFDRSFVDSLLADLSSAGNFEDQITGLLVHSENFQALNLMRKKYQGQVGCVYIDPPYNTKASEILYKNDYKDSSWLSLIENRARIARFYLQEKGVLVCAIDDSQMHKLSHLLEISFPGFVRNVVVVNHHPGGAGLADANISSTHEYALFMTLAGHKILQGKKREEGETVKTSLMRGGSGDNNSRTGRPNSFYAFLIDVESSEITGVEPPPAIDAEYPKGPTEGGYLRVYPINKSGLEGVWRRSYKTVHQSLESGEIVCRNGKTLYLIKEVSGSRNPLFSNWTGKLCNATVHGTELLKKMMGKTGFFPYPKSLFTVQRCIDACLPDDSDSMILDYFGGSGTTGHAVIDMNRRDRKNHFFSLVELGHHFDDVLLPRIKKAAYSKEWKDGKPVDREGTTQLFKYIRLESYEDTLDSLTVHRPEELLVDHEEYQLRYSLSAETQSSATLLGEDFIDPEGYRLSVIRAGSRKEITVDLAETFNFLLGLKITSHKRLDKVLAIEGVEPDGERCLILWRNSQRLDAGALDAWFIRHRQIFDKDTKRIYVNGDHTLNALRSPDDRWEALMIEPIFRRLMFKDLGEWP